MENVKQLFKEAASRYNKSLPHGDHARRLVIAAHAKLSAEAAFNQYGDYSGRPVVPYNVFAVGPVVSRPVRPDIYLADPEHLAEGFEAFVSNLRRGAEGWGEAEVKLANAVVYTSVLSVACCYDLWQRGSRKTPGTVFEILMAAFLKEALPLAAFSKHIPLTALLEDADVSAAAAEDANSEKNGDGPGSLSTDLVVKPSADAKRGIVIPLKITTRERIVQPFAHQRILDSAFGPGAFQSLLVCISETQLDEKTRSVKQVCVPGTVKLFQKHLAPLSGLYYCDVPQRYAAADMQRTAPVRTVGEFFADASRLLKS